MGFIMKKLTFLLLIAIALPCQAQQMVGRVEISSPDEIISLRESGFSIYHDELEGVVDLVVTEADIDLLEEMGYPLSDLVPLPGGGFLDLDPEYHTYEEFSDELQQIASLYPDLTRLDSIGHATQFPRTIWSMKISDNAATEEDELALFYIGIHHACEAVGGETLLYMMNHLLENYGIDPEITSWLDNYEIFFIPLLNPDGHFAVTSGINEFWRKNARDINNNGIYYEFTGGTWWTDDHEGVDLNRNYNWYWELGGSNYIWDHDYRGTEPFSEDETQAMEVLAREQRFVCGITFHSYGEVIIYPWLFNGQPAPDQDVLDVMAIEMAQCFIKDNGSPYDYEDYNGRNGQCRNWFYGFGGALAFCVELNPYPMFLPPGSQLQERTQRYYEGAKYLLERLDGPGITGHVKDAVTGLPLAARVEIQGRISEQVRSRFTEPEYGRFTRLLNYGTYTVFAGKPGYQTVRIENVMVSGGNMTELVIELSPITLDVAEQTRSNETQKPEIRIDRTSGSLVHFTLELPQRSHIKIELFNVSGRNLGTIYEGIKEAGWPKVHYNAAHLASGMYFYKITAEGLERGGNFVDAGKMLLLK
ncbi:hypothetical protein CEE37_13595 [candidate division LCP-89 bacterium B3_LCP]|uniref:Peptidase M14 domain-containing protein n=1 Tax=candidate division LCP-89 bacterium B3_LCP TaxID=2012998 RepID=A0A532UST0_UNCL8|nr:MAG: hypothetical protein CEE37_13595 [candidate division LCP-89 bacterium B3_LCP]